MLALLISIKVHHSCLNITTNSTISRHFLFNWECCIVIERQIYAKNFTLLIFHHEPVWLFSHHLNEFLYWQILYIQLDLANLAKYLYMADLNRKSDYLVRSGIYILFYRSAWSTRSSINRYPLESLHVICPSLREVCAQTDPDLANLVIFYLFQ